MLLAYGDHPEQTGDVQEPNDEAGPFPGVVLWHGGGFERVHGRAMMGALVNTLNRAGFVTYNATYRRLDCGGGMPDTWDDAVAAVDAFTALDAVDGTPAGVGFSAGGSLALYAAAHDRLSRVAVLAGVTMLAAAASGGGPRNPMHRMCGPGPYTAVDPVDHLPLGVPTLFVHGDADELVPIAMSRSYARLATAAGDDMTLVELPGFGHFDLHGVGGKAHAPLLEFLGR